MSRKPFELTPPPANELTPSKPAPVKELLDHFSALYQRTHNGLPYLVHGKKDGPLLSRIWHTYGTETTKALMDDYFASTDDWIRSAGYQVGIFSTSVPKLVTARYGTGLAPVERKSAYRTSAEKTIDTLKAMDAEDKGRRR